MSEHTFTVGFPFCGLGAGALGFLQAETRLFGSTARFRSVGGIDIDPMACRDFETLTGSSALCRDVAQLTVDELRAFMGDRAPDVVFSSPPCKGFSGLLSEKQSKQVRYRKLNRLVLDWVKLMLEAWQTPPRLFLLENVPRIAGARGKRFLAAVRARLRQAGYVFHAGTHDAGELGGLAQHRNRFLLVARHPGLCPPLLYQPPKKRVRGCGEVLETLPLPGCGAGGPMHELPKLSWLNWVRLALIPAGGDWRDLPGVLEGDQPRREVFRRHHVGRWEEPAATVAGSGSNGPSAVADPRAAKREGPNRGSMGVLGWEEASGTVTGNGRPSSGRFSVADPRGPHGGTYGVNGWNEPTPTITGRATPTTGRFAVADPRAPFGHVDRVTPWNAPVGTVTHSPAPSSGAGAVADPRVVPQAGNVNMHWGKYEVRAWDAPASTVIGATRVGSGAQSVADPRVKVAFDHGYAVLRWDEASSTVAGGSHVGQGAYAVGDVRLRREARRGVLGVIPWTEAAKTVTGESLPPNGCFAVADPRTDEVVMVIRDVRKPPPSLPVIIAADGTWHRPLTTLELAALQSLPTTMADGSPLVLASRDGKPNHSAWRERIGNAVPVAAAQAIAERMLVALLQAQLEAFSLSSGAVWVERPEAAEAQ